MRPTYQAIPSKCGVFAGGYSDSGSPPTPALQPRVSSATIPVHPQPRATPRSVLRGAPAAVCTDALAPANLGRALRMVEPHRCTLYADHKVLPTTRHSLRVWSAEMTKIDLWNRSCRFRGFNSSPRATALKRSDQSILYRIHLSPEPRHRAYLS